MDTAQRLLDAHEEDALWLLPGGVPRPYEGEPVNARYRKRMRLKSRHYRQGHNQFCKCWELWQNVGLALKKRIESGGPLPRRRVRMKTSSEPASPRTAVSTPVSPRHPGSSSSS